MATQETVPKPDQKWSKSAKKLWRESHKVFVLDEPPAADLLRAACWQLTRADAARQQIEAEGITVVDRFGQTKEHPAVSIERQAHLAAARLLREIGLDIAIPDSRPPRRPGTY